MRLLTAGLVWAVLALRCLAGDAGFFIRGGDREMAEGSYTTVHL
jgi:hypothetical protein